ncbi:MAG: HAD-IA family hydrolase [Lachnospiraceae bacterium]|nr:HAD-IA family hydrolase [Lachnospiraceae bacterium]
MKIVFFDLDGTITDPKEGITKSVAYALDKYGIHVEDLDSLCPFIGPPLHVSFQEFYGFDTEKSMEAVKYYREYYREKGIFECYLYEGIPELLGHLKEHGVKVVLATSKPTEFAKQLLEHFDIMKYFDYVSGSTMDGSRVEKADILRHALQRYDDVSKDDMIMIGDRKFDYIGAAEMGIRCILIEYGYGELWELEACKPFAIKKTVKEVQNFLDSI